MIVDPPILKRMDDELSLDSPSPFASATSFPSTASNPEVLSQPLLPANLDPPLTVSRPDPAGPLGISASFFEFTPVTWQGQPVEEAVLVDLSPGTSLYVVATIHWHVNSAEVPTQTGPGPEDVALIPTYYKTGEYQIISAQLVVVEPDGMEPESHTAPNRSNNLADMNMPERHVFYLGSVDSDGSFNPTGGSLGHFLPCGSFTVRSNQY